jgi:hypothetical protein
MVLTESWMADDHRILKLAEQGEIRFTRHVGDNRTNSLISKSFERLINIRRRLNLNLQDIYKKVPGLSSVDPVRNLIKNTDLLIIDNNNYWKNPRFAELIDNSDKIWVYPHSPRIQDINIKSENPFTGNHQLRNPRHQVLASGRNNAFLKSLHESAEIQTHYIGNLRYNQDYLNYISDKCSFGDPTKENILLILGSSMSEIAVVELINNLLTDGYNVIAKNHPRYHKRIFVDVNPPKNTNFLLINGKMCITRLTDWADLVISGISTAVQEAIIRQKPVIIAEYLLTKSRGTLPILAPEKLRAPTKARFDELYQMYRSDLYIDRLISTDNFIKRNVSKPLGNRELELLINSLL